MRVKLVVSIESLVTKATLWMALEAALIYGTRIVIAIPLVLTELSPGK